MKEPFTIRIAEPADDAARAALLAPTYGSDAATLVTEAAEIRMRYREFGDLAPGLIGWVAEDRTGHILGTIEASIRLFANGCASIGILFIEGIAVDDTARQNGIGTALVETAAQWAKTQGISELASDALLDDNAAQDWHLALGFEVTEKTVCFRRPV